MSKLNELDCSAGAIGNIGQPICEFTPGVQIGSIFGQVGKVFDVADTEDEEAFRTALEDAAVADDATERIFAVGRYEELSPTGEAAQDQTFASGLKRRTREATMQMDFTLATGLFYHASVKAALHNKQATFGELKVLDQGGGVYAIVGSTKQDVSNNDVMGFFRLSTLQISDSIETTYASVYTWTLQRGYTDPSDVDTNPAIMLVNFNPLDVITGLNTVALRATSTVLNTIHVIGKIGPGKTDLEATYGADLADVDAWEVTNADIGSADYGDVIGPLVSVTEDATGYTIVIPATGVDSDNPGTGKKVQVNLVAPSALAALTPTPVLGIEGAAATVTLF